MSEFHRDLPTSGDSLIPPNTPAGGGASQGNPPVGITAIPSRRRTGDDCANCGAPDGVTCQPFCLAEQYS